MKLSVTTESRWGVMWVIAIVVVKPATFQFVSNRGPHPLMLTLLSLALLLQVKALHHFFSMIHEVPFFRVMIRIGKSDDYALHVAVLR